MRRLLLFLTPLLVLLVAACGPGSSTDDAEPGTPTPVPTPADAHAIRSIDLADAAATHALLQQLGSGRVAVESVLYADLTGDMRDEAVVPITTDGTLGNIAFIVLTLDTSGTPLPILTRTMDRTTASGLVMEVDGRILTEYAGVYGPSDPNCCPSEMRATTFRWDGSRLQVAREVTEKQAPFKD